MQAPGGLEGGETGGGEDEEEAVGAGEPPVAEVLVGVGDRGVQEVDGLVRVGDLFPVETLGVSLWRFVEAVEEELGVLALTAYHDNACCEGKYSLTSLAMLVSWSPSTSSLWNALCGTLGWSEAPK